jgi:hypothetical protein
MYRANTRQGKEIHAPLPVVTSGCGLVDGPDVLQHQLHKHGFEIAAFEVLGAEYTLGLGVEVEVAPQDLFEDGALDAQLTFVQTSKLLDSEGPAVDGAAEDDVVLLWSKVDAFVVLFFILSWGVCSVYAIGRVSDRGRCLFICYSV